jgi:hypothetical protein
MITYPPALRRTGFIAPKAVSRFGLAIMEARAAETGRAAQARTSSLARRAVSQPYHPAPAAPRRRTVVRLWLPATLIFLLLAPFALLLSPLLYLAPPPYGLRPFATVLGFGQVLLSLGGTVVEVDAPDALVRIRLF